MFPELKSVSGLCLTRPLAVHHKIPGSLQVELGTPGSSLTPHPYLAHLTPPPAARAAVTTTPCLPHSLLSPRPLPASALLHISPQDSSSTPSMKTSRNSGID